MEPLQHPKYYKRGNPFSINLCKNTKLSSLSSNSFLASKPSISTITRPTLPRQKRAFRIVTGKASRVLPKNIQDDNTNSPPINNQDVVKKRGLRELMTTLDTRPESRYCKESLFKVLEDGRESKEWKIPIIRMNFRENLEEQGIMPSCWN